MRSGGTVEGDVDFGPDAEWGLAVYNQQQLRWFDQWLKGSETGVLNDPSVRIFVMGTGDGTRTRGGHLYHGGYWRSEREWPLARTEYVPYYLESNGELTLAQPSASAKAVSFEFDPQRPVPTIGGNIASFFELVDLPHLDANRAEYIPWYVRMRNIVPAGLFHQAESPEIIGARPPVPYACVASRCPCVPDGGARATTRGHGLLRRAVVGRIIGARHGYHSESRRRLPPVVGLPRGVPPRPRRYDPPASL